jgi:hypothetical protein
VNSATTSDDGQGSQLESAAQSVEIKGTQSQQDSTDSSNDTSSKLRQMFATTSDGMASQARGQNLQSPSTGLQSFGGNAPPSASPASGTPSALPAWAKGNLPTLKSIQAPAPSNSSDTVATALAAIHRGGNAAFELKHLQAGSHPARLVITATTLAFIPQAAGDTAPLTIPLASITSVETSPSQLSIKFNSRSNAAGNSQLIFGDSTQSSSQITAIRNLILAAKSHSRP